MASHPNNRNLFLMAILLALLGSGTISCGRSDSVKLGDRFILVSQELDAVFSPPGGTHLEHVFAVPNPSKTETMELKLVRRNCDCSDPIIAQARIAPGAEGRIKARVSVGSGPLVKNVVMQFATGLTDRLDLFVKLLVPIHPRISSNPSGFASLEILPGEEKVVAFDVNIHQPVEEPKAPIHVQGKGGLLTTTVVNTKERTEDRVRTTTVRCQVKIRCPKIDEASYPDGPVESEITVRHGDYALNRRIIWRAKQAIVLSPKKLFVRAPARGTSVKLVRLSAAEPFRVVSVRCDAGFLRTEVAKQEVSTQHEIEIEVSPRDHAETSLASEAHIEFVTDHPQQRRISFPVFVFWAEPTMR